MSRFVINFEKLGVTFNQHIYLFFATKYKKAIPGFRIKHVVNG